MSYYNISYNIWPHHLLIFHHRSAGLVGDRDCPRAEAPTVLQPPRNKKCKLVHKEQIRKPRKVKVLPLAETVVGLHHSVESHAIFSKCQNLDAQLT